MTDPATSAKALKLAGSNGNGHDEEIEFGEPGPYIDWAAFCAADHDEAEWLLDDVLATGRGHAIYAAAGHGKSLFMLWVAVELLRLHTDLDVFYYDFEMTEADLRERLEDMEVLEPAALDRLHYALIPDLPSLDSAAGGIAMMEQIDAVHSEHPDRQSACIIDTMSRAVEGEENPADTYRAFSKFTGMLLRRRCITWARLDHAGKDSTRGQRGSSAKNDDVDVVWLLSPSDSGIELKRKKARMGWVPESVSFGKLDSPLRFQRLANDWPLGTGELANLLDRCDVPLNESTRTAQAQLRKIGEGRRQQLVGAALRYRRSRLAGLLKSPDTPLGYTSDEKAGYSDPDTFPF